ncbi:hypothetical protein CSE45_0153 [Citreicella sp. SE45]|nr:hypothetical protein CSE45_0153 [Citreicella sp. SE45]
MSHGSSIRAPGLTRFPGDHFDRTQAARVTWRPVRSIARPDDGLESAGNRLG